MYVPHSIGPRDGHVAWVCQLGFPRLEDSICLPHEKWSVIADPGVRPSVLHSGCVIY